MAPEDPPWLHEVRERSEAQRAQAVVQLERVNQDLHQAIIDMEIRDTRRTLLREARRRGDHATAVLYDAAFLAVADEDTIVEAIMNAAADSADADSCDLRLYDQSTGLLRIRAHYGLSAAFFAAFAAVTTGQSSTFATALTTLLPVLVGDVSRSPIFAGQPTLAPMLAARSRAVASYPLTAEDHHVLGVLSFHYRRANIPADRSALVAEGAASALDHLTPPFKQPVRAATGGTRAAPAR